MFTDLLILFASIAGLWIGAELITKSAIRIAKSLALSEGFVGLTIVALGTSFPEITMSITGAIEKLSGQNDTSSIIVGNALGSSINQITLVLALAGLLKVMNFHKNRIFLDSAFSVAAVVAFYIMSQDGLISRSEGMLCLLFYLMYLLFVGRRNFLEQIKHNVKKKIIKRKVKMIDFFQLILGLVIIAKASSMVLGKGIILASVLGISEATVGILILGFGSSLPELIISISAAFKGATALSVSNLIGSVIVNMFVALGGGALISGWNIERQLVQFDIPYLLFSTIVVVLFILTKNKLEKNESLLVLFLYLIYISLKTTGF